MVVMVPVPRGGAARFPMRAAKAVKAVRVVLRVPVVQPVRAAQPERPAMPGKAVRRLAPMRARRSLGAATVI